MGNNNLSLKIAALVAVFAFSVSTTVSAGVPVKPVAKLPTIQGTWTPPKGVDWGCGKNRPVTVMGDKSRVCPMGNGK